MLRPFVVSVILAASVAFAGTAQAQLSAVRIASGLESPVFLASPPGDARLFIVERAGTIRVWQNGSVLPNPFLDVSSQVNDAIEGGLLGLAFAPDYATSGVFWIYFTGDDAIGPTNMQSVVARFTVSGNPATSNTANAGSQTDIFELHQPAQNHNGATIQIRDGFLYLALGDGGASGDTAQNDANLLGKMLRVDLDTADGPAPVTSGDWDIYAKGLRNPYRYSFDRSTGDLYIGDVGAGALEEINAVAADEPPGLNFGWNVMEGTLCNDPGDPGEPPCNSPLFTPPIFTYPNPASSSTCVTGGSVYRGNDSPSLRGTYFFGDACSGQLFSLVWTPEDGLIESDELTGQIDTDVGAIGNPSAIAEGGDGELYIVDGAFYSGTGEVFRLVPEPAALGLGAGALGATFALARIRRRTG